jgi:hypothetical protein
MTAVAIETRTPTEIRNELRTGLERLRENYQNGHCDSSNVIGTMRGWRTDLSAIGLWCLWEHIADAIERLACIRTPGRCTCHDYAETELESLEHSADSDLEFGIDRLMGVRP